MPITGMIPAAIPTEAPPVASNTPQPTAVPTTAPVPTAELELPPTAIPTPTAETPDAAGPQAPRFTLPSAGGEDVSLESYLGEKNLVLAFYRGFW